MSRSHFFHEFRTAARESRWILPIPSLALLLGVAIWHSLWLSHSGNPSSTGGFTETQRQARELLDNIWPYAAWLVPYAILKFPDLKDPYAFWRTTPTPARSVFGSRLLLALLFTVLIPALLFGGALLVTLPEIAAAQALTALHNQWIYFVYGAFAALVMRGHRGVLLTVLMGVAWLVSQHVVSDFYRSVIIGEHLRGYGMYYPLTRMMPGEILPVLTPVVLWFLIRRSTKTFRFAPWIAGAGLAAAACVLLPQQWAWSLLAWGRQPGERIKELPVVHASFEPISPADSRKEVLRERAESYGQVDPRLSFLARATLTASIGDYALNLQGPRARGNSQSFTQWDLNVQSQLPWIPYAGGLMATIPDAERTDRRAILRDFGGLPPYDCEDEARARLALIAGDPELQVLTRAEASDSKRTWVRLADLKHENSLIFFLSPPERKPGVALSRKVPPHLFSQLRLVRYAPPEILFRGPATTGGTVRTSTEVVTVDPVVMDRYGGRSNFNIIRRQKLLSPVLPGMMAWRSYSRSRYARGEIEVILINRSRHQAVTTFASWMGETDDNSDLCVSHVIKSIEVREVSSLIDKDWIKDAEIVLFVPGDDKGSELPVEFSSSPGSPPSIL